MVLEIWQEMLELLDDSPFQVECKVQSLDSAFRLSASCSRKERISK